MPSKYDILQEKEQDPRTASQELAEMLEIFLSPLLIVLDRFLDKRLVRTFVQCCVAIIRFRNNKQGLLLSELGSYMDGYSGLSTNAPAGTKRLGNLMRSIKWSMLHIDQYLLDEADKEVNDRLPLSLFRFPSMSVIFAGCPCFPLPQNVSSLLLPFRRKRRVTPCARRGGAAATPSAAA